MSTKTTGVDRRVDDHLLEHSTLHRSDAAAVKAITAGVDQRINDHLMQHSTLNRGDAAAAKDTKLLEKAVTTAA